MLTSKLRGIPRVANGSMQNSDAERAPAAATALFVGIDELEPLPHERLLPLEHRAVEVDEALRVDHHAHLRPVARDVVEHAVARARRPIVELDDVAETGATAAADPEPQARIHRAALLQLPR